MSNPSPSNVLASLFRTVNEVRPVVLLGAGASFRSGVPLAAEAVKRIAKAAYIRNELGGRVHPGQVKLSQWLPWLRGHSWFIQGEDRLAENFPLAVEYLLRPAEFRREVLFDLIEPMNGVSQGYQVLADFMLRGLVWTILTTNFDACLPKALQAKQPHLKPFAQVNRGRNDFAEFSVWHRRQIVWLHGCAEQYTDRTLKDEVAGLDDGLVSRLRPLLNDSPIIVIGYRGAEPSIMDNLLMTGLEESRNYRHGIYWCVLRREASLHPNAERFARAVGRNFHLLEIEGFDELMGELAVALKGEDSYASRRSAMAAMQPPQAPDEHPMQGMALGALDTDLMLAALGEYCRTVGRAPVTGDTLPALLRELGLVRTVGDTYVPTLGCCLLFARDLPGTLRHAAVAITRNGKKKIVVTGNLIRQRRELIDLLDSEDINPTLKVKGQRAYEERPAYPSRTLTELVVNLLVHRDYEVPELAEIEIDSGRAIRFLNAGGITSDLKDRIQIEDSGRFRPVRAASYIRNPSIADVFFGMRSMERAGSGLADVEDDMRRAGGDAEFGIDPKNQQFRAVIYQPLQAAPGLNHVARPVTPMGTYTMNFLPVSVLPERVSIARLRPGLVREVFNADTSRLPVFVWRGDELWSFAAAEALEAELGNRVEGPIDELVRNELEADEESRQMLSWLLRKHWEGNLCQFQHDGLFIERKKHRAYFRKIDGRKTAIRYDSPKRRGILREVVKARADGKWHENEGIGYEIVFTDGQWAIQVKPFYMFTRKDGLTPLPGFERTRRSTSRIKFDRYRNVDDDLTFWARYLGRGKSVINLGSRGVENLILEATFYTVEVPELGLLEESGDGSSHRLPTRA